MMGISPPAPTMGSLGDLVDTGNITVAATYIDSLKMEQYNKYSLGSIPHARLHLLNFPSYKLVLLSPRRDPEVLMMTE